MVKYYRAGILGILTSLVLLITAISLPAAADETNAGKVYKAHAISLFGEPKYGPDFTHFDYTNPDAPKGGVVTIGGYGSFDSLNPFILKGVSATGIGGLFDSLLVSSGDEHSSAYGLLAGEIEWPKDRSWVAFTLRPEARFHDGKPVTADDVVFSFDILMEKGHPQYAVIWQDVEKIEKLADNKVKFTFRIKGNRELPLTIGSLPVLPKHYWEDRDFADSSLDIPVGSGVYKVKELEAGRFIEYELDKNYWGINLPVNKGTGNFGLRIEYYRDLEIIRQAVRAGDVDYWTENKAAAWAESYDIPAVEQGVLNKVWVEHQMPQGMQAFYMNTRRPVFQNKALRMAVNLAFDYEWTNAKLFYNQYTRMDSYFSNSDMAATGLPEGSELAVLEAFRGQVPEEVFTTAYKMPVSDGSGNNRKNLRKAIKLLRNGGYKFEDKKLIDPVTGQQVRFEILYSQSGTERIINPWIKILRERLGMDASARSVDQPQYIRRVRDYDFDITSARLIQSRSPGNEQYNYFASSGVKTEGSRNLAGINDTVVDQLVDRLVKATSREEQRTYARALDRVLLWGEYAVPNWYLAADRALYWDKFGRPDTNPWDGIDFGTWWIDQDKAASLADRKSALK
jgi:microcin C transport system substrate-binding protein